MSLLRRLFPSHAAGLLAFVLAALAMQGLVPAGLMIAPASGNGAQIILCPQTHPLARAAAQKATANAAIHAAMGHAAMGHAAMGHAAAPSGDAAPESTAASKGQACAFAGAGALAGLLPDHVTNLAPETPARTLAAVPVKALRLAATPRLRPPLRAPPALI